MCRRKLKAEQMGTATLQPTPDLRPPSPAPAGEGQSPLEWTKHPLIDRLCPPLTVAQLAFARTQKDGYANVLNYWERHEMLIQEADEDALHHAPDLPCWTEARHLLEQKKVIFNLGANGSGKTEMGGKLTAEILMDHGKRVLCVATNEDASIHYQQRAVYKYLPPHARAWNMQQKKPRHKVIKINYTPIGGFTEGNFMLPNRSECSFKTVAQYERDANSFEGPEYDFVWIDEPAPIALVDTLIYRARKRAGRLLLTFTSLEGFTLVCARALEGARIIKTLPMQWDWLVGKEGGVNPAIVFPELKLSESYVKGCPPGHMPFIMQPMNFEHGVIFTWTHWNPFLPRNVENPAVPDLFMACTGKGREEALVRLFGWTEKTTGCQLANLDPTVHVIPHERIEKMLKAGELTTYMAVDPVTARSYFAQWKGVDRLQRQYIIDEFPRMEEGEWVTIDGKAGEGQRLFAKLGIRDYKKKFREREREHGQTPIWRKGDPRAFATAQAAAEGGVTLFELFSAEDRAQPGEMDYAPMQFDPAQIRQTVKLDIDKIKDLLAYNSEQAEANVSEGKFLPLGLTPENEPHLYISDRCKNTLRCWQMWDGTADSPAKDGVDATRYNFDRPAYFMDPTVPDVVAGRGWGAH
jgi:phage terminase large subunit-like protein